MSFFYVPSSVYACFIFDAAPTGLKWVFGSAPKSAKTKTKTTSDNIEHQTTASPKNALLFANGACLKAVSAVSFETATGSLPIEFLTLAGPSRFATRGKNR